MVVLVPEQTPIKARSQRLPMSYEDYLAFASEKRIMEWVEEEVIIYMPLLDTHQTISLFLSTLLDSYIGFFNLGQLIYAPFEVKLWPDGPAREPDLLFITQDNRARLTSKRFEGGPDLVIEIVSPSSVTEDRVRKFTHYEQAGVQEYWIIDPRPHQRQVDFYVLDQQGLFQAAPLDEQGRYHSQVLPNFWLDPKWLWQRPLPNAQLMFTEVMVSLEDLPEQAKETFQALRTLLSS